MFTFINQSYASPRRSGEYIDCSMPMTFDTYSNCGFNCLYCFSTFQRSIGGPKENYLQKKVKKVNFEKIEKMFRDPDNHGGQFKDYIKNKYVLQRGGLSDPFCPIEEQGEVGLKLLKLFNELKYPVRFSSKGDLILRDARYLEEFKKGKDIFAYMASIITYDPEIAKKLEAGTPSPKRRMEVLKALSDVGVYTVLRLRPYIVGITDKTVKEIIDDAGKAGVKAMSTEFFCVEGRSTPLVRQKFDKISELCGFDIYKFYKRHSNTQGYMRLSREFTRPYMDELVKLCVKNNIKLAVSCPKHKEKTFGYSCCGMPTEGPLGKTHKGQYMYAIMVAKEKGFVQRKDIEKFSVLKNVERAKAYGLNTGTGKLIGKNRGQSMNDTIKELWNNPKKANSPYKLFEGVLIPKGIDEQGNVIYFYNPRA